MSSKDPIKIAVIGGGLAGATVMNALLKHPHINAEIFESASEFSERGAAVGISQNGQDALEEMGILDVLDRERSGAVVMNSSRLCMASGPDAMSDLFDLAGEQQGKVVHRAALLKELLKPIPEEKKNTNKILTSIENLKGGRIMLHFQDGTQHDADAVFGADGIRGHVRKHVLGPEHPAVQAKFAGFWDARSLISMGKAKELLGASYFEEQRQYGWIGNGGFFMHDVLDEEKTVQCVCSFVDDSWNDNEWKRELDRKKLEQAFSTWTGATMKEGMINAMLENKELAAYPQSHHEVEAHTYAKGPVCILGDAAHCTTPWQGAGASQAFEDALVLNTIIAEVKDTRQLTTAFKAYDQVRRPRTQRVVRSSKEVGLMMCGRGVDTGLDAQKLRDALPPRWGFIFGIGLKDHKREVLEVFHAMCEEQGTG